LDALGKPDRKQNADVAVLNTINAIALFNRYPDRIFFGRTLQAGVFDEGAIQAAVPELTANGQPRVTVMTKKVSQDEHATKVALVLAANGKDPNASGIARELRIMSFDKDSDLSDLAKHAAKIHVSNHSYNKKSGWLKDNDYYEWWGGQTDHSDANFGKYGKDSKEIDRILADNPYLVSVVAAGNQLAYVPPFQPADHYWWQRPEPPNMQGHWIESTIKRLPDLATEAGKLDTIAGLGISKNAICVGAIQQLARPGAPQSIADFSSWGPTDDGRVKPDLVAPGQKVNIVRNGVLKSLEGTSFAAPIVAGLAALLIECFEKTLDHRPTAAEIKALLIHTARREGGPGPDPKFGWGLVDAVAAADVIAGRDDPSRRFYCGEVVPDAWNTYTYTRPEGAARNIRVTLVWTDPPAPENEKGLNDRTPTLINDLDVVLLAPDGARRFYPYSLDSKNPLSPCGNTEPNRADNVEVIDAFSTDVEDVDTNRGAWRIEVKAQRIGHGSSQKFAVIVSSLEDRRPESQRFPKHPVRYQPDVSLAARNPSVARAPGEWRWLGPTNLGGPTRALAIHPTDPNQLWAGSDGGGLWRSKDGGHSWSPVATGGGAGRISSVVINPSNLNILYAATGPNFVGVGLEDVRWQADYLEALPGIGLLKSTDGGSVWNPIPATRGPEFLFINCLALSKDGRTLLVGTPGGIWRSTDGGKTVASVLRDVEILDLKFHPTSSLKAVAGGRNGRAFQTEDGGVLWSSSVGLPTSKGIEGRVELAFAAADPRVIYASVDQNGGELYRSDDAGKTYKLRNKETNYLTAGQGWYANTIWAGDSTDPNLVLVGGLDLYRSSTGGTGLTKISDWVNAPVSLHTEQHTIINHPGYNGKTNRSVFVSTSGGVYLAADVGTVSETVGWSSLNEGYGATPIYRAAGSPITGQIIAGAQSFGTIRYRPPPGPGTGPGGYTIMFGGSGGTCAVDPTDPNFLYGEYVLLQINRSVDGGSSVEFIYDGIPDAGDGSKTNIIAPLVLDPNNANVMLAGGSSLWRSTNVKSPKPEWHAIKPEVGSPISAVEVVRGDSDTIWVGHNDGQIYRTRNGRDKIPSWTRSDQGQIHLPDRYCSRIVIDPNDRQRVYITYATFAADNIWRTDDDGKTFVSIGKALPPVPVYCLAVHPQKKDSLYAGTSIGLFVTEDGGKTWLQSRAGPGDSIVTDLFWMNTNLVAATYGRGLFDIDLAVARR
jgi:photosystem II stability/assembly factor-like uncharacterized protein